MIPPRTTSTWSRLLWAAFFISGCTGAIDQSPEAPGPGAPSPVKPGVMPPGATPTNPLPPVGTPEATPACRTIDPGPAPVRRLTRFEYDNTIRDLLGENGGAGAFPGEEEVLGFRNNASAQAVSPLLIENYASAAEGIASRVVKNLPKLMGCDPAKSDSCVRGFIDAFGRRAFRRPVTSAESTKLLALYDKFKGAGAAAGVQVVLEAMLQSSSFLYRVEAGEPVAGKPQLRKLNPYETATRLSYLMWGSMPDEALFAAAAANKLGTPAEIRAQAERMLTDPRAKQTVHQFGTEWLSMEETRGLSKDTTLFPAFTKEMGPMMAEELERFFEHVMWEQKGDLATLLSAPYAFWNGPLSKLYGEGNLTGTAFSKVMLDPNRRSGLMTMPAMLATLAVPYETHPILRGKFVRTRLLCDELPDPPDAAANPPKPDPKLTTRERFSAHAADPACEPCHRLIDPIGLALENYDAVGRWRTSENGKSVDVSGNLIGTDVEGPFTGGVAMSKKLAASSKVRACVVKQWFRFGYGRGETPPDACTLELLEKSFEQSGGKMSDLFVALTQTPTFLYRPAPEGVSP